MKFQLCGALMGLKGDENVNKDEESNDDEQHLVAQDEEDIFVSQSQLPAAWQATALPL